MPTPQCFINHPFVSPDHRPANACVVNTHRLVTRDSVIWTWLRGGQLCIWYISYSLGIVRNEKEIELQGMHRICCVNWISCCLCAYEVLDTHTPTRKHTPTRTHMQSVWTWTLYIITVITSFASRNLNCFPVIYSSAAQQVSLGKICGRMFICGDLLCAAPNKCIIIMPCSTCS